jgi:hypothetical protein
MTGWRVLAAAISLLTLTSLGRAQPYPLIEVPASGDCFRVQLSMKLTGEMRVQQQGKIEPIRLSAEASHEFPERVLVAGKTGLVEKSARLYEKAQGAFTVGGRRSERQLRTDRRLVVAQRQNDQLLLYCPKAALTREELSLTSEHFDTLTLTGLLPGRAVAVGDTWKPANAVVQALCGFEGLAEHHLGCKLEGVKDNLATVRVAGDAKGIDTGALAKLSIDAVYHYDLAAKRLVDLEWQQKDERDQGPASPAMSVQSTTTLKRQPIAQTESLSDVALVSVPEGFTVPPAQTNLEHQEGKKRFELFHERGWQLVGETEQHTVLRYVDRGDFVAQVTITPWTPAGKGKHLSADEFKEAMSRTPGWEPERELQAGEVPGSDGKWIYRVSAMGRLDGVEVMQNFYLVADALGRQVVLAFTFSPKQAEKLGTHDLSLVGSLEIRAEK